MPDGIYLIKSDDHTVVYIKVKTRFYRNEPSASRTFSFEDADKAIASGEYFISETKI